MSERSGSTLVVTGRSENELSTLLVTFLLLESGLPSLASFTEKKSISCCLVLYSRLDYIYIPSYSCSCISANCHSMLSLYCISGHIVLLDACILQSMQVLSLAVELVLFALIGI